MATTREYIVREEGIVQEWVCITDDTVMCYTHPDVVQAAYSECCEDGVPPTLDDEELFNSR